MGRHFTGELHLVGDKDHGAAFVGEALDDLQHLAHQFRVKRRGRFVEQHGLGVHAQSAGDGGALLLTTGHEGGICGLFFGKADPFQQFSGAFLGLGARAFQHMHRHFDQVFQHRLVGPEVEVLEHHAKALPQLFDLAAVGGAAIGMHLDLFTADFDVATGGGFQKVDAAQHGRFARTRAADDRHHVAFAGTERHAFQHLMAAEAFEQAADADRDGLIGAQRFGHRSQNRHVSPPLFQPF